MLELYDRGQSLTNTTKMGNGDLWERKKPGDGQAFYAGGWIVSGLNDREYMDDGEICQST